jgi:hypothetical protein
MTGPDEVFVLNQQTCFVSDLEPVVRDGTDAESEAVPMHLVGDFDEQFPHPHVVPWQGTGKRIFKEPVERDVGTSHEVDTAVKISPFGGCIKAKLSHPETSRGGVAVGAGLEDIKVGRVRGPQTCSGYRHGLENILLSPGASVMRCGADVVTVVLSFQPCTR